METWTAFGFWLVHMEFIDIHINVSLQSSKSFASHYVIITTLIANYYYIDCSIILRKFHNLLSNNMQFFLAGIKHFQYNS